MTSSRVRNCRSTALEGRHATIHPLPFLIPPRHDPHPLYPPENLLLTHRGGDAEVKIIDFGLSKILSGAMPQAKSFLGTRVRVAAVAVVVGGLHAASRSLQQPSIKPPADVPPTKQNLPNPQQGYLAPEMLQRQTYSKTIDVWALGVIVFVLLCGCLPFDDDAGRVSAESVRPVPASVRPYSTHCGPGGERTNLTNKTTHPQTPTTTEPKQQVPQRFQLRFPSWASNLSPGAKDLLCHLLGTHGRTCIRLGTLMAVYTLPIA